MADADKSVMDFMGKENIVYINIANKLSVDCDCNSNPADPKMADIGVFGSAGSCGIRSSYCNYLDSVNGNVYNKQY